MDAGEVDEAVHLLPVGLHLEGAGEHLVDPASGEGGGGAAHVVDVGAGGVRSPGVAHLPDRGDDAVGVHVAGGVGEDEAADVPAAVQQVVAHHAPGELHAGQALGIDPHSLLAVDVQDLHVGGEGEAPQPLAVGAHRAGEVGRGQGLHLHPGGGGGHLDQGAGLDGGAVHAVGVGVPVGGQDADGGGGVVVAVLVGEGLGGAGEHQAPHRITGGLAGGDGGGHLPVPAQQQGDRVPHLKGPQVAQGVGGGGGLDVIGLARNGHRGGGGGGGDGLNGAGDLVGVHPQGVEGVRPVDHVVGRQGGGGAGHPVPGDGGGADVEGDLALPARLPHHHRALHGVVEEGHGVDLALGGDAVAQHR